MFIYLLATYTEHQRTLTPIMSMRNRKWRAVERVEGKVQDTDASRTLICFSQFNLNL